MRLRNILFVFLAIGMTAFAQDSDNMINVTRTKAGVKATHLNGKGGAIFESNSDSYVIRTTTSGEVECDLARRVGNHYEYEVHLDVASSSVRVFVVQKKGMPISGKSQQVYITPNEYTYFKIEEPEVILSKITEKIDAKSYFAKGEHPVEALIEINSPVELDITFNQKIGTAQPAKEKNGTFTYGVIVNTTLPESLMAELNAKAQRLQEEALQRENNFNQNTTDAEEKEVDRMKKEANEMAQEASSICQVSFQGKSQKTNVLSISPQLIKGLKPKDKLTFSIAQANRELTFEDLLSKAREYYESYPQHTESSFYDAARVAYDKVLEHDDCPMAQREVIRAERDTMASIRKVSFFRERTDTLARKFERQKGFECDEVYKYLSGEYKFATLLATYHPEVEGFKTMKEEVFSRLKQHPKSMVTIREEVTIQRQQVSGKLTVTSSYIRRPLNTFNIYAIASPEINFKDGKVIGRVREDGSFNIVMPDKMHYIFFDGEKDKKPAHYVGENVKHLDIELGNYH